MKYYNELLNETNDTRLKIYFSLSDLVEITGLSIRSLKYRMLKVKERYLEVPSLLRKENRVWRIHYTIVKEFDPKYNIKTKTIYNFNWVSMATWNPKDNFDVKYHVEIVKQIKKQLPESLVSYAVEIDGRGINHTHLISNVETHELNKAVTTTIRKFIEDPKQCKILVQSIDNKYSSVEYLRKAPISMGFV